MRKTLALTALGALVGLAACSGATEAPTAGGSQAAEEDGPVSIECALSGNANFARDCVVERARQDDALYLVVRHPDGAFRRFQVLKDGRGVAVADGADEAVTKLDGNMLEVTVGKDRYRFPATRQQHAPTS